jgi:hypothetical protein
MNNPLKYTDPSGYTWWSHFWGWAGEKGSKAAATAGKLAAWIVTLPPSVIDAIHNGDWSRLDPFNKGTISNNCYQITTGLFRGTPLQILSRFTWELPQTILGYGYSMYANYVGRVSGVDFYDGATVLTCYGNGIPLGGGPAVTLGSFIVGNNKMKTDPNNWLFQHEYGHYLQSQAVGWAYLNKYAIPSLFSDKSTHDFNRVEQDANARAFNYFNKHVPGFYKTRADYYNGIAGGWDFYANPLDPNYTGKRGIYWDYNNSDDMELVNNLILNVTSGDYSCWLIPGMPIIVGIVTGLQFK